jgi:hypothetical protein
MKWPQRSSSSLICFSNRVTHLSLLLVCLLIFLNAPSLHTQTSAQNLEKTVFLPLISRGFTPTPALKWQRGGCTSWCQTGWYSSPAVINIDGDPQAEVIASAYSIWALDGVNGGTQWTFTASGRTWPGIALGDINRDGQTEIIVAQSGPVVRALRLNGTALWSVTPSGSSNEFRGLLIANVDGDNSDMEILVTRASGSGTNAWLLGSNGSTRSGWPQMTNDTLGYSWGVYNNNAAAGNLDGDADLELVIPSDVHYINALNPDGSPLQSYIAGKFWGHVGGWEDWREESEWGNCYNNNAPRNELYRANFADGPAVIADVNGDGIREVVVSGNMYDCRSPYTSRYIALFIFNPDRSRFNTGGHDWRTIPVDTGAPMSEDYNTIESYQSNPVVADLDSDGKMEILFSSYDGRVHAFWLDKTEHGFWPFPVYNASEGFYRFASEPLVVDFDNNGLAEVLFTSWTQKGSNRAGKLHILNHLGQVISETELPLGSGASWDGGMAAPTLANIDTDPDLEVVINTAHSGVVAYDIPGSAGARILWGTGRGDFTRRAFR